MRTDGQYAGRTGVNATGRARPAVAVWLGVAMLAAGCGPDQRPGLPPAGPFSAEAALSHGVAIGDPTATSAVLWVRTVGAADVRAEWTPSGGGPAEPAAWQGPATATTGAAGDFTASLRLEGLVPGTTYRYRVFVGEVGGMTSPPGGPPAAEGTVTTAPAADVSQPVTLVWSGDLGGQHRCREEAGGYAIFDRMLAKRPAFGILLGDLVYSDDRCPSPPAAPGGDFIAMTLDGFRAKHRYNRGDPALQRFLAAVPVYAIWDDHEVRNNFSGPFDPLMPLGRRAFFEYWPIAAPKEEPNRLYRRVRYGADLEVFVLDTRQYRSRNGEPDGPNKTMLGPAQRAWLLDGLARSGATWKVIVTSVPLAIPKPGSKTSPGCDSWARAADGTGFQTELNAITDLIQEARIRNVVWLATDVHYVQINEYDPDRDGAVDFREFVAGPLSAAPGKLRAPDGALNPTTLYTESGYFNFGVLTASRTDLRLEIVDEAGVTRYERTFPVRD
jgi:alkaline phosphatase D